MKAWHAGALGITFVLLAGCSETGSIPTEVEAAPRSAMVPGKANLWITSGPQAPPYNVPSAYQHYTWINVSVDVGWNSNMAYGQAIVQFGANNATADIELVVRNSQGTTIGSNHGTAQASYVFPGDHVLYASTNVFVSQTCGLIASATAAGSAFDSFLSAAQSMLSWGKKTESASNGAYQPVCTVPTPPPTSPTGGDGSTPPSTGGTTPPPTYEPAPFVPSGHWECVTYFQGTDYQRDYCTFYPDYDRLPKSVPRFALSAGHTTSSSLTAADLPSVFVIVSDQVPADAMAVIERHKQGPFKNVLLVPSSTIRPAVLVAALQALASSRGQHGETPDKEYQLTLKGDILDQQIPAAARDYAASFASLIANAKRGDAGTYGQRPILELRLGDKK
jgi:hypothetical protein